jgi:hypothetical protein
MAGMLLPFRGLPPPPARIDPIIPGEEPGGLWHLSASQIDLFRLCPRKWFFKYITKLKEPSKGFLTLGKALHGVAERYLLKYAELYPQGWSVAIKPAEASWVQAAATAAIETGIWPAAPGAFVEYPVCLLVGEEYQDKLGNPTLAEPEVYAAEDGERRVRPAPSPLLHPGTCYISGFIDYYAPAHILKAHPVIHDHKTAKNRRYGKTKESVQNSVQLKLYAWFIHRKTGWMDVESAYNVFLKDADLGSLRADKSDIVYQVSDTYRAEALRVFWQGILADHQKVSVLRTWTGDRWGQIEVRLDTDACAAYGGCPFKPLCLGQCNIAQLRHRLENPHAADTKPEPQTFSLNLRGKVQSNPTPVMPGPIAPPPGQIGASMPFPESFRRPADPIKVKDTVFVADPSLPYQYKGEVVVESADEYTVALWPDAIRAPQVKSLDPMYVVTLPKAEVTKAQHKDRVIKGYAEALKEAGSETPAWQPDTVAAAAPTTATADLPASGIPFNVKLPTTPGTAALPAAGLPATATGQAPDTTEPEDEKLFASHTVAGAMAQVPESLAHHAEKRKRGRPRKTAEQPAAETPSLFGVETPAAPAPTQPVLPNPSPALPESTTPIFREVVDVSGKLQWHANEAACPEAGDLVMVLPGQDGFWADKGYKYGFVQDTLVGDGKITATLLLEGHAYPDVDVSRLKLIESNVVGRFGQWIGKPVHVVAKTGAILRYTLESITGTGLKFVDVPAELGYEQVASICAMEAMPIPGDAKDAERVDNEKVFAGLDLSGHLGILRQRIEAAKISKKALALIEDALVRMEKYAKSLPICEGAGSLDVYDALADKAIQAVVAALKGKS